jgi:uncharacterized protein YndB with AHSA1/START domain
MSRSYSDYRFVTRWTIPAPIDRVWRELMTPDEWPTWWRGVERVELLRPGTGLGVGALRRYTWKSRLPYRLSFTMETTRIDELRTIEGEATGELQGRGRWSLDFSDGQTRVEYVWEVETTKRWMRLLSPLARPLFAWNHDVVMEWGRVGLLRRLGLE